MSAEDLPLVFDCRGEPLVGILHGAGSPSRVGVVMVVGGPQYRVGSHRQFVLIARYLAGKGIPVLRFDYRGMGDSGGEFAGFEGIDDDIRAAVDCLFEHQTQLDGAVLWGLCDAAAASMMYAGGDSRVVGMLLLNPWVHSEEGRSRTLMRNYYLRQLGGTEFWKRLFSGKVNVWKSAKTLVRHLARTLGIARSAEASSDSRPFTERMLAGVSRFEGSVEVILSGEDLTAAEFTHYVRVAPGWRAVFERPSIRQHMIPDANHTFSTSRWRREVEARTLALVEELSTGDFVK